jgi:hypothetical protein
MKFTSYVIGQAFTGAGKPIFAPASFDAAGTPLSHF